MQKEKKVKRKQNKKKFIWMDAPSITSEEEEELERLLARGGPSLRECLECTDSQGNPLSGSQILPEYAYMTEHYTMSWSWLPSSRRRSAVQALLRKRPVEKSEKLVDEIQRVDCATDDDKDQ